MSETKSLLSIEESIQIHLSDPENLETDPVYKDLLDLANAIEKFHLEFLLRDNHSLSSAAFFANKLKQLETPPRNSRCVVAVGCERMIPLAVGSDPITVFEKALGVPDANFNQTIQVWDIILPIDFTNQTTVFALLDVHSKAELMTLEPATGWTRQDEAPLATQGVLGRLLARVSQLEEQLQKLESKSGTVYSHRPDEGMRSNTQRQMAHLNGLMAGTSQGSETRTFTPEQKYSRKPPTPVVATAPKMVMSPEEAAEFLGIATCTVREHLRNGAIPGRKVGGRWILSRPLLERWTAENR